MQQFREICVNSFLRIAKNHGNIINEQYIQTLDLTKLANIGDILGLSTVNSQLFDCVFNLIYPLFMKSIQMEETNDNNSNSHSKNIQKTLFQSFSLHIWFQMIGSVLTAICESKTVTLHIYANCPLFLLFFLGCFWPFSLCVHGMFC